jgi:hypothetical protein
MKKKLYRPLPKEGENNLLEFPSCSVSWLTLSYWRGMGEAFSIILEPPPCCSCFFEED